MNTMAAATSIALGARALSLTINAPTLAGELAIARATACIASGRAQRLLAGGVDENDPFVGEVLRRLGADLGVRGEGAGISRARILGGGASPRRAYSRRNPRRGGGGAPGPATRDRARPPLAGGGASASARRPRPEQDRLCLRVGERRPPAGRLGRRSGRVAAPHRPPASALSMSPATTPEWVPCAWEPRRGLPAPAYSRWFPLTQRRLQPRSARINHRGTRAQRGTGSSQVAIVVGPPPPA